MANIQGTFFMFHARSGNVNPMEPGRDMRCALVDSTVVPSLLLPHPTFGPGGTTDLSAGEITGANYIAGGAPLTITVVPDPDVVAQTRVENFTAGNISYAQDNGGFAADFAIIYDFEDGLKRCRFYFVPDDGPGSLTNIPDSMNILPPENGLVRMPIQ